MFIWKFIHLVLEFYSIDENSVNGSKNYSLDKQKYNVLGGIDIKFVLIIYISGLTVLNFLFTKLLHCQRAFVRGITSCRLPILNFQLSGCQILKPTNLWYLLKMLLLVVKKIEISELTIFKVFLWSPQKIVLSPIYKIFNGTHVLDVWSFQMKTRKLPCRLPPCIISSWDFVLSYSSQYR